MKDKIQALKAAIIKATDEARTVLDNAKEEKLSAEEQAKYDKIIADVNSMMETSKRMESQLELENELRSSDGKGIPENTSQAMPDKEKEIQQCRNYLKTGIVGNLLRVTEPSEEKRVLQADAPAAGGYVVLPMEMAKKLIQKLDDMLFLRKLATVIPLTSSDSLGCPSLDENPEDASQTSEVGEVDEDTAMTFGMRELKPHVMSKLIKVSRKLLNNAMLNVEDLINIKLAYKFNVTEEKWFMSGTGSGQALGLFTASNSGISTSRDYSTGNTATEIRFDALIGCMYNIKEQYQKNAAWIFHRDGMAQIAKLKDGEGRYIWSPSQIVGQPNTLYGKPIYISEYAPATFTASQYVGMYGDYSFYWIADNQAWTIQRLAELYARNRQIGYIADKETDGMPILEEAFSRLKLAAA